MKPALTFAVVSDSSAFQALREPWTALWARLDGKCPFLGFDWCWNAWTHVAERRGYQLRIVTGSLNGRLVLVFPLMLQARTLHMLSAHVFEYRDLIVEPSERAAHWVAEAWSFVMAEVRADAFIFHNLQDRSILARTLSSMPNAQPLASAACPVIRLDRFTDWDAYAATLSKNLLSDQRRRWRKVRQVLPGISFRVVDQADRIPSIMDWIVQQKIAWGDAKGIDSVWLGDADKLAFLKAVAEPTLRNGQLVVATLADGETIISAGWGYLCGSAFVHHAFAYDAAYSNYSPSRLYLESLVRLCFDMGASTFDMMFGEESYKGTWATEFTRTESYGGALTWRGAIKAGVAQSKAALLRCIKA